MWGDYAYILKTTIKKVINCWGKQESAPPRKNPGYAYEKHRVTCSTDDDDNDDDGDDTLQLLKDAVYNSKQSRNGCTATAGFAISAVDTARHSSQWRFTKNYCRHYWRQTQAGVELRAMWIESHCYSI